MSDIVTDLRDLRTQLATVLDDETILDVLSRAASEIEKYRLECKSFLAWRWEQSRTAIVASSKFVDDSSYLEYVVVWSETGQRWRATFEGSCVCVGSLADCMSACEEEERYHDNAVQ